MKLYLLQLFKCRDDENPIYQKKFIVFSSALLSLFTFCFSCRSPIKIMMETIRTFLRIKLKCPSCSFTYTWESQPLVGAGNLAFCNSIICSGSMPSKSIRLLELMNCQTISQATYFKYHKKFLHPAIDSIWKRHQNDPISLLQNRKKPLILGGDARCNSPGYCAKFGSYTLLELESNQIVEVELVQVYLAVI